MTIDNTIIYFDLDKRASKTSVDDIAVVENELAVMESIENILTNESRSMIFKKRTYGCNLQKFLFEPIDTSTAIDMLEEIETAISRFESRISDLKVRITPLPDDNTFKIDINCTIEESDKPLVLTTTLEKLR